MHYLHNQHGALLTTFDRFKRTPLDDAIDNGHIELAEWLMARGALSRKDTKHIDMESDEYAHIFKIFESAKNGNVHQLSILLDKDPKLGDYVDYDGRTPLHLACVGGNPACVQLLLLANVNPVPMDRWNITPKDEAKRHNHVRCVDLLNKFINTNESNFFAKRTTINNSAIYGSFNKDDRDHDDNNNSYNVVLMLKDAP